MTNVRTLDPRGYISYNVFAGCSMKSKTFALILMFLVVRCIPQVVPASPTLIPAPIATPTRSTALPPTLITVNVPAALAADPTQKRLYVASNGDKTISLIANDQVALTQSIGAEARALLFFEFMRIFLIKLR